MEIFNQIVDATLENINSARENLDEDALNEFEETILMSDRVFLIGEGRSGLVAKTFARRLTQLGLRTYVVGETTSSSIHENDCLVVISGSGETNTVVSAAGIAKSKGSKVLVMTSFPESTVGNVADCCVFVKGRVNQEEDDENYLRRQIQGNYTSLNPLGVAFEVSAMVFLDAIVIELIEMLSNPF